MPVGKRSSVTPQETFALFHTEEAFRAVAKRFQISVNTLRQWWVTEFGQEAFTARGKAIQAKAASAVGKAGAGRTLTIAETSEPCSSCGTSVTLNLLQKAKTKVILCLPCDEKARGVDRRCPVCDLGCVGAKGLANHMAKPKHGDPAAHAAYLTQQEAARFNGKQDGRDFVTCAECGFRGQFLGNHIKLHGLTADAYYTKHPGALMTASVTEVERVTSLMTHAVQRAYNWTREDLSEFLDEAGRVIVAKAALAFNASPLTVLQYCRKFGLPTRNKLAWQRLVLDQAAKFLGEKYVWEWSDPRITNSVTGRVLNFDGFFPQHNIVVEAHGDQHFRYAEAWHGTMEDFHALRERDTFKKRRAEELGFRVFVVRPSDPTHEPSFWQSLMDGVPSTPLTEVGVVFNRLRQQGFPSVVPFEAEVRKSLTRLQRLTPFVDDQRMVRPYSTVGTAACASYFPGRYHARYRGAMSVREAWDDDVALRKAIELQIASGHPTSPERVLRALTMYHRAPSVFRPVVAKFVYQTFAPKEAIVWDPCVGYGGRLIGAMSAGVSLYIGTDIEDATVRGNRLLSEHKGWMDRCRLVHGAAESFDPEIALDLVFTSPPYYDLELYGDAFEASVGSYVTPQGWVNGFLRPVIERSMQRLKSGGYLVLNLPDKPVRGLRLDLEAAVAARDAGFMSEPSLWMPVRTFKGTLRGDPLLVWRKPVSV